MRVFIRITLLCLCAIAFHNGRCDELDVTSEDAADVGRSEDQFEQKKDGKSSLMPGGMRRPMTQNNGNATRDSQLLSLLRNRRRQMFSGRLASHINTIASLASKGNKNSSTFAQLEITDSNNSLVKRITLDNVSSESPTIKVTISNGTNVIQQNLKPHEVKQIFLPKLYQDNKSRGGFFNNRRKSANDSKTDDIIEKVIESGIVYLPPEGLEREVILEPDEEFQVDESNHGLYLLNYSDPENVTISPHTNIYNATEITKATDNTPTPLIINVIDDITTTSIPQEQERAEALIFLNSTDNEVTKLEKIENNKDKSNNTLFISDDISKHFRPLEPGLPVEEMAPFINFGQKINSPIISDNLTNTPSFSASTKSVNFIVPPVVEKRKFNSRYSATEKYRNTSVNEEEINEDMDVSVVKNVIEKNKVRNTVKGPAPARHVGLINAYRKYSNTTPSPPINSSQTNDPVSNVTEPIVENMLSNVSDNLKENSQIIETRSNTTSPKNFTRNYFNIRRRPSKLSILSSTENNLSILELNTTTEKASTVYTAVVTSVSITSSMKGPNKNETVSNSTIDTNTTANSTADNTFLTKAIVINSTESSLAVSPTTPKQRHRIRIRTTTTESSLNTVPSSSNQGNRTTVPPLVSNLSTNSDLKNEATSSRLPERLVNLFRQNEYESSINGSTVRPKNILKRRRPTTTTTTTMIPPSPTFNDLPTIVVSTETTPTSLTSAFINAKTQETTVPSAETTPLHQFATEPTKINLGPSSKPQVLIANASVQTEQKKINVNTTMINDKNESISQNEEVVIEAEKNYTASYVLAGLGFLPVAAIIAFILRNVLNKKTKELDTEYEGYFEDSDIKKESPITPVARPPLQTPSKLDQKWEFPRNKLRLQTLLGQGNFGQVWKAEADDLNGHDGLTRLVAVKTIKETASQKEKQELLHEIYIMQKIGTHPNVVTLLACCSEQEPYLLIMEYVMCGKLLTYLRERRSRPDRFSGSGALTSRDLTVFAYCVARGMDYIASKGIVHRDLAARNILVDHNKLCKVADFGMSRAAGGAARGRHALPVRWMAPEALLYNVYSHQTDVWAFGILLWEIVTLGSTPYAAMSGREVLTAVTEGYRLERPPHCKPQLYRAMHSCWHADPSQRPTFSTLKSQLADLLDNEISEGNYVDLDSFYQESSVYSDPSAIIHDEEGLSAEYDRERRVFRELNTGPAKFDNRSFNLHDEELRNKFGIGTPRMGGFGIRDLPFNDRNFSDGEFNDRSFTDKNFNETNSFTERKDGKLSTSSFHRDRDRENPLVSRNSFNGFPRIGPRENHFQMSPDGRNKRVPEFECDI